VSSELSHPASLGIRESSVDKVTTMEDRGPFSSGQEQETSLFRAVTVRYPAWYPVRAGEISPDGD
jgi:hypothetical protein